MFNSPIRAREAAELVRFCPDAYAVVIWRYGHEAGLVKCHRTLKSAHRTLSRVIANRKHNYNNVHLALIRTPQGALLDWTDARNLIQDGAL